MWRTVHTNGPMGNLLGRLGRRLGPEWKVHLVGCCSNSQTQQRREREGLVVPVAGVSPNYNKLERQDRRAQKRDTVGTVLY
jgi:hypothetical protein